MNPHITYNPSTNLYTVWDESGANIVIETLDRDIAFKAFDGYGEQLEEDRDDNP